MELFIIYRFISPLGDPRYAYSYGFDRLQSWLLWTIALVLYAVICVFKGIGLYTMAKKQGKSKLLCLCACVPFASTFVMGEFAQALILGNVKIKHIGLYAMIAEIVLCACYALQHVPESMIFSDPDLYQIITEEQGGRVYISIQFAASVPQPLVYMMNFCNVFGSIFYFIWLIAFIFLCMLFFRIYAPASYVWMVILCAFFPVITGFFAFAFRHRNPVDFDQFMKARMEQIRRAQQAQYGPYGPYSRGPYGGGPYGQNPYGQNPYGQNPYGNPYGQNGPGGQGAPKEPEDPFGEYSSGPSAKGEGEAGNNSPREGDPFGEYTDGRGDSGENKNS